MPMISKIFPLATEAFHREEPYCSCAVGDRVVRAAAVVFLAAVDILRLPFRVCFWVGKAVYVWIRRDSLLTDMKERINQAETVDHLIEDAKSIVDSPFYDDEEAFRDLVGCLTARQIAVLTKLEVEDRVEAEPRIYEALYQDLSPEQMFRFSKVQILVSEELLNSPIWSIACQIRNLQNSYPQNADLRVMAEDAFQRFLEKKAEESAQIRWVGGRPTILFDGDKWFGQNLEGEIPKELVDILVRAIAGVYQQNLVLRITTGNSQNLYPYLRPLEDRLPGVTIFYVSHEDAIFLSEDE